MTKEIPLTKGKVALVDDEDFARINEFKWFAYCPNQWRGASTWYAARNVRLPDGTQTQIQMHRFIMNPVPKEFVDHINQDGLDNRRANLRLCTNSQNQHNRKIQRNNTSGYRGVVWCGNGINQWQAIIQYEGKRISLKYHRTAEQAARAYDKKAKELFGEFAILNFPDE